MSHLQCEQLEAYLARGLGPDDSAAFADHLPGCPACRREVESQTRIDALLRAAVERLNPLPGDLLPKVEAGIARHRRRGRLAWVAGLCAAAVVLLAIGSWAIWRDSRPGGDSQTIAQENVEPRVESTGRPRAEVVMADAGTAIVVPLKSKRPDVTIVWIYPTVKPGDGSAGPESD